MSKFFVTAAIPYVNAKPHIGNVMDVVIADALARYHRQQQTSVLFSAGSDEHGSKAYHSAKAAGQDPEVYAAAMSQSIENDCRALDISYDKFTRTHNPEHIKAAQTLWQQLADDIYKGTYKGWYCTGCEEFVTDKIAKANKGICPDHQKSYEQLEEENYFFKLSKYTEPLKQVIEAGELKIVPEARKHEILALLNSGLEDVSFSRPKAKLPWGVPVPGDAEHVMYVWPDALTNYLTAAGYPEANYEQWWPADVHIIGKGVLRFHAAIWPGMLLAAKLPLPKAIYAHGYITAEGQKMSKTVGNIVDPIEVAKRYGTDALRYYLLREVPGDGDGDYSPKRLEAIYNSALADDLGNLVQRVVTMINQYQKGVVGEIPPHSHDVSSYKEAMADFRLDLALAEVWVLINGLNQYIEEEKPWQLAKAQEMEHLGEVLAYLVSNILQVAHLLEPFLPQAAVKINQAFADGVVHPEVGLLFPKAAAPAQDAG